MTEELKQPEALRLADWLQAWAESIEHINAANELRRLYALTQRPAEQAGEVDIKSRVSELIAEHGTLRAAARSLNIDVGYLSRLEHGDKVHPSSETLAKIGLRDAGVKYQRLVFLPTQPAAQATLDQFADASNMVATPKPEPMTCHCETCRPITLSDMRMVLCPKCGNKRCPHATDHRNACTNSNAPGQPGSSYAHYGITKGEA